MKTANVLCIVVLSLLLVACSTRVPADDERDIAKPNIIFIMADDLAWADVGYNGAKFYETPNIDAMAREGMVFNRFYPAGPNCAPTRACIVTGMYTPRHKLYQPGGSGKGDVKLMRWQVPTRGEKDPAYNTFQSNHNTIDGKWVSIAETIKPAGYVTARIGKWHLGSDEQGFDLSTNDGVRPFSETDANFYSDIHVGRKITDRAIEFIEEHRDRPFMIYLNHWEVHGPLKAERSLVDKYTDKKKTFSGDDRFNWKPVFAAEVEVVDRSVGRIRATLAELGLDDNTLVIFTSDNGGAAGSTNNLPLHGAKGSLFEGGIRTACVAVWPGRIRPGSVTDTPVSGVDMMPTFAELARADLPTTQPVDGTSIVPLLTQQDGLGDRAIFWHYPLYLAGTSYNRVLPVYGTDENYWRGVPASAIMRGDWKLIHYYEYDSIVLFNLKTDPGEKNDLSETRPEIAAKLKAELAAWVKETGAPVPNKPNPKFAP